MQQKGSQSEDERFVLGAIISDYDGTLAPHDVRREDSAISSEMEVQLQALAKEIPFAIVTSKDFSFIYPRARFASAWACVSGLEIISPDGRSFREEQIQELDGMAQYVREIVHASCTIEPKRSSKGHLLGLSVDWRYGEKPSPQSIKSLSDESSKRGYYFNYEESNPFFDIYGAPPNKGRALLRLKRLLNIRGPVMYIGDSTTDNEAFLVADVPVCVLHGQLVEHLGCKFAVRYDELTQFLHALRDRNLVFTPRGMPGLTERCDSC